MTSLRLAAPRVDLVPATLPVLRAGLEGREALASLLGTAVAKPWPPPLNDDESQRWMIRHLEENPDAAEWGMWHVILRDGPNGRPLAIGTAGFKGKPTTDGVVEIGYSIVEGFQGRGLGTEAAHALVRHAFDDSRVARVIAETYPHLVPSIRVLTKNGFVRIGEGTEPGVIRFGLSRGAFDARGRAAADQPPQ